MNVFAIESFMDELALAKTNPVEFRLKHLPDRRSGDVVQLAAVVPEESVLRCSGRCPEPIIGCELEQQCAQQSAEMVEDRAEIVASATEQRVDRITAHTGEEVAVKAATGLHVADHRSCAYRLSHPSVLTMEASEPGD